MANKKKPKVESKVRVNAWNVMTRAIEEGIDYGWNRAHKHTDKPTEDEFKSAIYNAVTSAISEYFEFTYEDEE